MSPTVADAAGRALKRGLKIGSRPRAASKVGPDRTGRGTCHEGAGRWSRRREAPIRCGFARTYEPNGGGNYLTALTPVARRGEVSGLNAAVPIGHMSSSGPRIGEALDLFL